MPVWKSRKAKKELDIANNPQPMSGGDQYQAWVQLKTQEEIDKADLTLTSTISTNVFEKIKEFNKKQIGDRTLTAYMLLQKTGDYFCNTCKFETKDLKLKETMYNVIRGAFLFGRAGIYFDKKANDYYGVSVDDLERDVFGKPIKAKISALTNTLGSEDGDLSKFNSIPLNETQCEGLIVFNWGTMAFSAWYMWYRICKQMEEAQKRICALWPSFNKKFVYYVDDPSMTTKELEAWNDPLNTFIVQVNGTKAQNSFEAVEYKGNGGELDFIEFYNKTMAEYYALFGIKVNKDVKKERNISTEVDATQDSIETIQREWLNQFELFIEKLSQQSWCPTISIKEEKEDEVSRTNDEDKSETRVEE